MATALLTITIIASVPAVLVRDAEWSLALGVNALLWAGVAMAVS